MPKSNIIKMSTAGIVYLLQLFLYLIPMLTAIITLSYLGYTFDEEQQPDLEVADWRRKWLIFFAWLTVVVMVLNIVLGTVSIKSMASMKRMR